MQPEVADHLPVDGFTAVNENSDSQQEDGDMYYGGGSEPDVDDDDMGTRLSRLSIESSDSDASTELSDEKTKLGKKQRGEYQWRRRSSRESRLERTWEMRRCHCTGAGGGGGGGGSRCVVVRPRGLELAACMCMDMDEVRACRDLGLELPRDWTVEIPPEAFHRAPPPADDTSSGGDSPVGRSRHISTPGDDPRDVKARLRVWAQAVALASASRLGR